MANDVGARDCIVHGEVLKWSGNPSGGLMLRPYDWFLIPFGLCWLLFSILWVRTAYLAPAAGLFWMAGVPFLFIGFYLSVGRFLIDTSVRLRTTYIVTDAAVYIRRERPLGGTKRFAGAAIENVDVVKQKMGRSTITFQRDAQSAAAVLVPAVWPPAPILEAIADAPLVYDLILEIKRRSATSLGNT